jgi:hypothetical protein
VPHHERPRGHRSLVQGDIETGDDRTFRQALLAADLNEVLVSLRERGRRPCGGHRHRPCHLAE